MQLGSFANKANAEKLAHQLKAQGASVYVISSGSGASLRYRVRVGPLADREAAERTMAKLKAEGHAATIVTRLMIVDLCRWFHATASSGSVECALVMSRPAIPRMRC